LRFWCYRGR